MGRVCLYSNLLVVILRIFRLDVVGRSGGYGFCSREVFIRCLFDLDFEI